MIKGLTSKRIVFETTAFCLKFAGFTENPLARHTTDKVTRSWRRQIAILDQLCIWICEWPRSRAMQQVTELIQIQSQRAPYSIWCKCNLASLVIVWCDESFMCNHFPTWTGYVSWVTCVIYLRCGCRRRSTSSRIITQKQDKYKVPVNNWTNSRDAFVHQKFTKLMDQKYKNLRMGIEGSRSREFFCIFSTTAIPLREELLKKYM